MATKTALGAALAVCALGLAVALFVAASGDEPDPTTEASATTGPETSIASTSATATSDTATSDTATSDTASSEAAGSSAPGTSTAAETSGTVAAQPTSSTTLATGTAVTDTAAPDPTDTALDPACSGDLPVDPPEDDGYRRTVLCGWPVWINNDLFEDPLATEVYRELALDMQMVLAVVPAATVRDLQSINIWLELDEPAFPGGVYHPSAQWLENNGYPTKWARGVQFGVARNYLAWPTQQPAMLLHELTHARHDQQFGADQPDVLSAYDQAMAAGLYDSVEYVTGGAQQAYAATNHHEYLAELTEAYFWTNDYYPFDRQDLADHDPVGLLLVEQIWGIEN